MLITPRVLNGEGLVAEVVAVVDHVIRQQVYQLSAFSPLRLVIRGGAKKACLVGGLLFISITD
jgi:hypothetical protein